ncbi:MAG: hypothetical protein CMJ64_27120 [Planctomycetaceae bacterium]|nr:hypothetical protein [Planctomycetaceae bacterium]
MKTRVMQHKDGRREVVRVLTTEELVSWSAEHPLAYEKSIVWLENTERLRYVRVAQVRCATSRRGPLLVNTGERVVGYSKLMPDAPRDKQTHRYCRRLFYLTASDREQETETLPNSAIDPRTVLPGVEGIAPANKSRRAARTKRAETATRRDEKALRAKSQ